MQDVSNLNANAFEHIERLGINGLLALAVVILWRKLQEKDAILMKNHETLADALASNRIIYEKMSDTLDDIKQTVEKIETVRRTLAR